MSRRFWTVLIIVVAGLLIWQLSVRYFGVQQFLLPAPSDIGAEYAKRPLVYARNLMGTLETTLLGFAFALVGGVFLAVLIVHVKLLEDALYTILVALNSLPKVALAPLFVIWLGPDIKSKVSVAFTIAIFPIVIDTALGLRSVEPEVLNMAKVMRASQWEILRRIRFQQALPSLFAGMKVAVSLALVGAIVGEFVAGGTGLGSAILAAQGAFDTPQVFACIVLLGFVGTALFYAMDALERWLIPWHSSQRAS
jgi:NitT/TauT family transport system permease protein